MSPDLTSHHGHACPLAIAEAALVRRVGRPRSLSPERQGATLPTCVASEVLTPRHDVAIGDALRAGVANLVQAQLVAFPGNLFWDIDCLVASVLRGEYHSVLGDREKAAGTFREFVVMDQDQVYPEILVRYTRRA